MPYAPDIRKDFITVDTVSHSGAAGNTVNVGFRPSWVHSYQSASSDGGYYFGELTGLQLSKPEDDAAPGIDSNGLLSFTANGFTHGTSSKFVKNNYQTIYHCWKGSGNTGAVNTSGSITANVSANASIGFSITKFTGNGTSGATIPHGLGKKPEVIVFQCKSETQTSGVWVVDVPTSNQMKFANTDYIRTRHNSGKAQSASVLNQTEPTNSLITLGNSASVNDNGETFVAIAWRSVKGISKAGFYQGTGAGIHLMCPFVYTGFKPALIWIKEVTTGYSSWRIFSLHYNNNNEQDCKTRRMFNPKGQEVGPNGGNGDGRTAEIYMFSNGFRIGGTGGPTGDSNKSYFYMAFAHEALVSTNNIPTTGV